MHVFLPLLRLIPALLLAACVTHTKLGNDTPRLGWHLGRVIDHDKDPWNALGIWRRIADKPPSYVPTDLPSHARLDAQHGHWVVDVNDGWRFFVPKGGTRLHPESLLKGEAVKITNDITTATQERRNAFTAVFVFPFITVLAIPAGILVGADQDNNP